MALRIAGISVRESDGRGSSHKAGLGYAVYSAAVMAVAGEWGTVTDHGLFAAISGDHSQALWLVQLFLAVAVLGGLVLASQVAELARAEAALRASERAEQQARLAAREARAAERARLARDLHDSVSQALFSMSMQARTAQLALARVPHPDGGPLARAVGQLRELAAGALAEMRALIFELRPAALAEEGLVAALARQAAAISAREGDRELPERRRRRGRGWRGGAGGEVSCGHDRPSRSARGA